MQAAEEMAASLETRGGAWACGQRRTALRAPARPAAQTLHLPARPPAPLAPALGVPLLSGSPACPHTSHLPPWLPGLVPSPATHADAREHTHTHTHWHDSELLAAQWTDFPAVPDTSPAQDEKLQNGPGRQCAGAGHAQRCPADFIAHQLRVPEKGEHLHHFQVRQPGGAPNVHVPRGIPVSEGLWAPSGIWVWGGGWSRGARWEGMFWVLWDTLGKINCGALPLLSPILPPSSFLFIYFLIQNLETPLY